MTIIQQEGIIHENFKALMQENGNMNKVCMIN